MNTPHFLRHPYWYAVLIPFLALVVGAFFNLGCPPAQEPWKEDTSTFDVDLASNTQLFEENDLSALSDSDLDNYVFTFSNSALASGGYDLAVGKPLVLHGLAVRKITSVTVGVDTTIVETEFIPLNEVITDGQIIWDYGVEFTPEKISKIQIGDVEKTVAKQGEPIDFEVEYGEYTYHIQATLADANADFTFTVTKSLGSNANAQFIATGTLNRFRCKDDIQLSGGTLSSFDHDFSGLSGTAELELIMAGSGSDAVNLKLPVTIISVPFIVGFLPMELNINIQFVINASVPVDGSAHVKTGFDYNSDIGFTYNGTTVSAGGNLGGITFGEGVHQTGASSAISANFGIGFPRVELSILGDTIVPWAQTAFLVGGSYTFYPACQTADALFLGAAGYDLGLFGLDLLSGSITLFQEEKELLRAGECDRKTVYEDAYALQFEDSLFWLQDVY